MCLESHPLYITGHRRRRKIPIGLGYDLASEGWSEVVASGRLQQGDSPVRSPSVLQESPKTWTRKQGGKWAPFHPLHFWKQKSEWEWTHFVLHLWVNCIWLIVISKPSMKRGLHQHMAKDTLTKHRSAFRPSGLQRTTTSWAISIKLMCRS